MWSDTLIIFDCPFFYIASVWNVPSHPHLFPPFGCGCEETFPDLYFGFSILLKLNRQCSVSVQNVYFSFSHGFEDDRRRYDDDDNKDEDGHSQ